MLEGSLVHTCCTVALPWKGFLVDLCLVGRFVVIVQDFASQFNARCWKACDVQVLKLLIADSAVWITSFVPAGLEENVCVRPSRRLKSQVHGCLTSSDQGSSLMSQNVLTIVGVW